MFQEIPTRDVWNSFLRLPSSFFRAFFTSFFLFPPSFFLFKIFTSFFLLPSSFFRWNFFATSDFRVKSLQNFCNFRQNFGRILVVFDEILYKNNAKIRFQRWLEKHFLKIVIFNTNFRLPGLEPNFLLPSSFFPFEKFYFRTALIPTFKTSSHLLCDISRIIIVTFWGNSETGGSTLQIIFCRNNADKQKSVQIWEP